MAKVLDFTLEGLQTIVSALSTAVRSGYGPSFQHTIVSTATGNVLITNHGMQIIKTLELQHPIARYIVSSVTDHYKQTGDGSKTFLILLNEMLIKAARVAGNENNLGRTSMIIKLCQDFSFVLNEVISILFQGMDRFCVRSTAFAPRKSCENFDLLQSLLCGMMNSHLLDFDATHVSSLLAKYIDAWHSLMGNSTMQSTFDFLTSNQRFLLVENPGKSLSASCLLPGYLISRGFCNAKRLLVSHTAEQPIRFILLSSPMDALDDDLPAQHKTPDDDDQKRMHAVVNHKRLTTLDILSHAQSFGISLIITSFQLSTLEKALCFQHKIVAIHTIPEDEIDFLSRVCNMDIVFDTNELSATHVGNLQHCEQLTLGPDTYTNLQPESASQASSLIVCGPTEAISRQAKLLVVDALQVVRGALVSEESSLCNSTARDVGSLESVLTEGSTGESSRRSVGEDSGICGCRSDSTPQLSPSTIRSMGGSEKRSSLSHEASSEYLYTIPVGGAFELALHHVINNHLQTLPPGAPGSTALTILREALLAVPQQIHANAYYISKPRWLQTLNKAKETVKLGHPIGIHAVEGTAAKSGLTHSFPGKCRLIVSVLTTLHQLLRLDGASSNC